MPPDSETSNSPNNQPSLERTLGVTLPLEAPFALRWTVGWLLAAGCLYAFAAFLVALVEAVTRPSMGGLPGLSLALGTTIALVHAGSEARRTRARRPVTRHLSTVGSLGLAIVGVATVPGIDPVAQVFIPSAIALAFVWLTLARAASSAGRRVVQLDAPAPRWAPIAAVLAVLPMLAPAVALAIIGP